MSGIQSFLVSFGHEEYSLLGVTLEEVWAPVNIDDDGTNFDDPEAVGAKFLAVTGAPPTDVWHSPGSDVDLSWEVVNRVSGTLDEIEGALDSLIDDIDDEIGGDDTVFDYWPSAVRLARAVNAWLTEHDKQDRSDDIEAAVKHVIFDRRGGELAEYADELYGKIGFERPEVRTMFRLEVGTTNAAFEGPVGRKELVRIILAAAGRVGDGENNGIVLDANGNSVASFGWS